MKGFSHISIAAVLSALCLAIAGLSVATTAGAATTQIPAKPALQKKTSKKKAGKKATKPKLKRAPKVTAAATFEARGSVGDAYVRDATPGIQLLLVNRSNRVIAKGKADSFGSKIFYDQKPGPGYSVLSSKGGQVAGTKKFAVLKPGNNPPQSFYDSIHLDQGLNYVKMRDGIELAITVRLPSGKTLDDGPFPTFIEHSGYQTAAPNDALTALLTKKPDPLAPAASTAVGSIIGPLLDFATVSVQMRGSGCSGGAFDLFGLPTTYDGYDAVEAVAAQPWVKGDKVGMGGISFSGISQLFAAGTQPPHLAAISPMSITDDLYQGTGYPGGIFNKGFALTWMQERMDDAEPAPEGGQPWAKALTTAGDLHCIENQRMRLQTRQAVNLVENNPYRTPKIFENRAPAKWMKKIKVPVFFASQFQDEQTGGRFGESLPALKNNPNVWMILQNGVHVDSLGPSVITQWIEFMNLFVADRVPVIEPYILGLGPMLYDAVAPQSGSIPLQQSRFADYTSAAQAKADFKKMTPRVRLLMENGNAAPDVGPGAIGAKWELDYSAWPPKEAKSTTFFLGNKGALVRKKSRKAKQVGYRADPKARPARTVSGVGGGVGAGDEAWKGQPNYDWQAVKPGKGLGFTTAALTSDTVIAGTSGLDLFMKSSRRDTDLQVTLSEVRPDGKETYVQNGFLRASHRKLNRKLSTVNDPYPTHLKRDAAPMPKGKFVSVRVPIFPVGHVFRAGSKLRVTVQAVGGDRPYWDFDTVDRGKAKNTILLGGKKASKLVLPIVKGGSSLGNPLPPPTALRGQPSRDYVKASNGG